MKTEKEIREMLRKCKEESYENGPVPENCPFGSYCLNCPECTIPNALVWVLEEDDYE